MTRVTARRYAFCMQCSTDGDKPPFDVKTVQWIVQAPLPKRNSWSSRKPAMYVCQECGTENY